MGGFARIYTEGEIRMATTKKPVAKVAKVEEVKAAEVKAAEVKAEEVKAAEVKVEAVKAEVKKEAAPKAEAKKAPAKKEAAPKAEAKKAPVKKEAAPKAEAKKAPAKKEAVKKAEVKANVNVQFAGRSLSTEDLVKMAKDVWEFDLKQKAVDFKTVDLYVKPEECKVYFVVNGKEAGSFAI